jgi:hypothetical protein
MSEWIKCVNEMPAQGQTVIAFSNVVGVSAATYWQHEPGIHDGCTHFCAECGDEVFPVTHWQPLPEPPTA